MTTEEFYTLSERCKGRYLRIDHNSDKTLLIYSPAVEPAGQGNLILRSSDAYEIRRYIYYSEKIKNNLIFINFIANMYIIAIFDYRYLYL